MYPVEVVKLLASKPPEVVCEHFQLTPAQLKEALQAYVEDHVLPKEQRYAVLRRKCESIWQDAEATRGEQLAAIRMEKELIECLPQQQLYDRVKAVMGALTESL